MPEGRFWRMSPIFLRTWYQRSGTSDARALSFRFTNTTDSPGFV